MSTVSRWISSLALAAGLGVAALAPAPAQASDDLVRIIVDVADVVLRGNQPYYRHGNYGRHDQLVVVRDRYGHPTYYRHVPRNYRTGYRPGPPPHARAWGHPTRSGYNNRNHTNCDRNGRCTVRYYDARYDRDHRRGKRNERGRRGGRW